ncbi:MAG: hypothetical protein ABSF03_08870 [Streptosporangiaceae bacterium]|jgi:hypothetical protein
MNSVRRRCEARLRQMTLPDPFDLAELCQTVSARRGRPLHVRGVPRTAARGRPCGIWIATDDDDWIFVDQDTSRLHGEHIVVHELAHMLCGHDSTELPENDMMGQLFPNLSPDMVRTVLSRASYHSEHEREAELLASLILAQAQRATSAMPVRDVSVAEMQILRRAGLALGMEP